MREIKFRAWLEGKHGNITFNEPYMEYGCCIGNRGGYLDITEDCWDIHGEYVTIPVMQYTGLKDKNGKEIYESDIVRWQGRKYEIIWKETGFWLEGNVGMEWFHYHDDLEVLGNKYEG